MHEAYMRLVGDGAAQGWNGRGHFFAAAATAMRRILVERVRKKRRLIHGGGRKHEDLEPEMALAPEVDHEILALDIVLNKLAARDPLKARLVELRYFAVLTGDQTAAILGISPSSADRQWTFARACLRREVGTQLDEFPN